MIQRKTDLYSKGIHCLDTIEENWAINTWIERDPCLQIVLTITCQVCDFGQVPFNFFESQHG